VTDARDLLAAVTIGPPPRELPGGIYDITTSPPRAHYDLTARAYDVLVGSTAWHRLLWKTTPAAFRTFAERIYSSRAGGPHVEVGCGSLLFTAHLYGDDRGRPVILVDQSIQMLQLAARRLAKRFGAVPRHVALVLGDARDLRLEGGWASTVLAMHVLHVVHERRELLSLLSALARVDNSTIGLTSIFHAGGRGDAFLSILSAANELAPGLTRAELERLLAESLGAGTAIQVEGSMAYMVHRSPEPH
jgi:SAM-dependent methyltransferase